MAAKIQPGRVTRADVDAVRDFRVDFLKPVCARSKNYGEPP